MGILKPRIVRNPLTHKKMTLTAEQQWRLFEKGVILDVPFEPDNTDSSDSPTADQHV